MRKRISFGLISSIHRKNFSRKIFVRSQNGSISVYFPFRLDCVLVLTIATGGQLKYPLRFVTLDIPPDDEITIEAVGLNKTSTIGFRLYSPTE